jgi:hypothetical protein
MTAGREPNRKRIACNKESHQEVAKLEGSCIRAISASTPTAGAFSAAWREPIHILTDGAMREVGCAHARCCARVTADMERRHEYGQDGETRVELHFG